MLECVQLPESHPVLGERAVAVQGVCVYACHEERRQHCGWSGWCCLNASFYKNKHKTHADAFVRESAVEVQTSRTFLSFPTPPALLGPFGFWQCSTFQCLECRSVVFGSWYHCHQEPTIYRKLNFFQNSIPSSTSLRPLS